MSLRDAWETRASDWVRWAQSPELNNDFWDFHVADLAIAFMPLHDFHLSGRLLGGGPASG